ncbi:alanyl-tRNA synthetase [Nitzschia inconspicua]|uniref:Alanine--tRNA ligase n=1 Tax=Nitzschia inconspicua TaxID=303405 RepID=A0A9K3LU22_9STRA|nr:alanyl-tRNA synthetase [Nitzschia inconspicua]
MLSKTTTTTTDREEWSTDRVRSTFVEFFEEREHIMQPSSACAPLNDPTLLFTNAGMNQFKPIFLGQVDPNSPLATLKRACNSQKCIRAGGKHNDLEDVGRDTYHHTFFEMLGTWSFGDYFKKEAIDYAWTLLTEVYRLDPDRLYATYFQGDDRVEEDVEAREFWLQYLPPERVIGCSAKDNFWEMGDTGPCGPCSEIHYDRIGGRDAAALVNADDPDVIEIWNIVFIQYNRDEKGLNPLPQKHIDTGMGLERLVSILQNKSSNYDIDVFTPIFDKLSEFSNVGPYEGKLGEEDASLKDTAYRAIADHIRTLSFAIADGAVPNNEGRGYVLRRILRRATRYGQQILKAEPGFFQKLVPVVVETFGDAYPELVEKQATITEIIAEEEVAFSSMLDRGIKFFADLEEELRASGQKQLSGDKAFYLYDTLGFPIDLTELMAEEAGLTVDSTGFANEMEAQKKRSREARAAAKSGGGVPRLELIAEQTAALAENGVLPTDDSYKYKWDVKLPATVMSIYGPDGFLKQGESAETGDYVGVVLDKSSFYAEAGGQEADTGELQILDDSNEVVGSIDVRDVQTYGGYLLHIGVVTEGSLQSGLHVNCRVDYDRRRQVAPNHSMTHILNAALREVLGDAVDQRGSLCNDEKLRFDFSHKKAMSLEELRRTEEICQEIVQKSMPVTARTMPLAEAQAIDGVRAVFGEVYPDPVRVVQVGDDTSIEFCGGTHIANTAEAEAFVVVEETAVAKGIRRITAVTRDAAREAISEGNKFESLVKDLEGLSVESEGLDKQAGALRKEVDEAFMSATVKAGLRNRLEGVQKKATEAKKAAIAKRVNTVLKVVTADVESALSENVRALVLQVDIGADSKASQQVINAVKKIAPEMAFMGLSEEEPGSGAKLLAFSVVPESLIEGGLKADEWVRKTLEVCGGRGGGKAENAQGQASTCSDIETVVTAAKDFAESKTNAEVS